MAEPKKQGRAPITKSHYRLQIDFEVRADTLESAIERVGKLFRRAFRNKLREGLVYMGAHSATVRHVGKRNRYHPTVQVKKDLPIEPRDPQEMIDQEEAERAAAKQKRKLQKVNDAVQAGAAMIEREQDAVTAAPAPAPVTQKKAPVPERARKPKRGGGLSLAALMGEE